MKKINFLLLLLLLISCAQEEEARTEIVNDVIITKSDSLYMSKIPDLFLDINELYVQFNDVKECKLIDEKTLNLSRYINEGKLYLNYVFFNKNYDWNEETWERILRGLELELESEQIIELKAMEFNRTNIPLISKKLDEYWDSRLDKIRENLIRDSF